MDPLPEYSLFLGRILEELDTKRNTMTYQDLCQCLCARFDLVHLDKIRSLLFYTACLDPTFPATLFKDKMRCSTEDLQSKKLMVAADIVTMFNLIQVNGEIAKDKLPVAHKTKMPKKASIELRRSDSDAYNYGDCDRMVSYEHTDHPRDGHHHHNHPQQHHEALSNSSECTNNQFIPTSDPNFLLRISKELKCRAPPPDKLHHLPQISSSSPPSVPPDMQSAYFPMDIDSESTTDQDSLRHIGHPESLTVHSCTQKRNLFKEDFHNFVAFSPQVGTSECKQGSKAAGGYHRRDMHKPATFFNHSFELPYSNPYFESALNSPLRDRLRVKHESLDDLQASTYFGPTTVSEHVTSKKHTNKAGKQPAWPVKSLSLNTEEGPRDFDRPFLNSKAVKENHRCNISVIDTDNEQHFHRPKDKVVHSPGFAKTGNEIKTKDVTLMGRAPTGLDKRVAPKNLWDKNRSSTLFARGDNSSSVGTQTELTGQKKVRDYPSKYNDRERHNLKHSDEDSEIISDDISDIFRFLDDMSVCDSLGIVQSSCHNSNGSLSQGTLKSEGDSSPERNTVKLAKSKLDRLFHSLENTDDELKLSVCKLVMRIGEIETKLESLSGVRSEISQVLSKLNKLDEKIQEPETHERCGERTLGSESGATPDKPHPHPNLHSNTPLSSHVFQCHTTGHNVKMEFGHTGEWVHSDESNSDSLRMKALKRGMFTRRSSCSPSEENTTNESKVASITNSPCDWRTVSHTCHPGDKTKNKDRERENKDRHRRVKEVERDQQYELSQSQRPPKPKDSYLTEQVFSSHPFSPSVKAHVKGSLLYTDLRPIGLSDGKRSQASWTIKEYRCSPGEKGNPLTALDLQTQESLNPNNLEYWMEDIYTPGYNSLLKKKEAEFRRAKACKIGALIAAATCTVILVIVVPICTMTS
ncbi:major intrinsically disordered Notch2-binding receptor 1 isoform 1-T1 [Odontesthes bonariensis]|uniref:major intrinsically disordered Notch2-binding receptor 1 n=1 Tax=Odontesthes bonariensis TaxID=219752 RepID=UPI003F583F58